MFSSKAMLGLTLLFSSVLVPLAAPVGAQPPDPVEPVKAPPEVAKLAEIEAKAKAKTLTPQQQLAAYEELLRDYPQASVPTMTRAILKASEIKRRFLGDSAGALALVQSVWGKRDFTAFPTERLQLATVESRLLLAAKKPEEAAAIMEEHWEALPQVSTANSPVIYGQRVAALAALGKDAEAIALLENIRYEKSALLNGDFDWMWDKIIEYHLLHPQAEKMGDSQALRWAKLRFMLCAFDEAALARATTSLTLVWASTDPKQLAAFLAAQDDPTKANPLASIAVPDFDETRAPSARVSETKISLWLCSNTPASQKLAMTEAFKLASARSTAARGTAQVCRIFKACDLNTRRANAFLASFKDEAGGAAQRAQLFAEFLAERN